MQTMRREWIKEGKPLERERDEERRESMPYTAHASSDPIDASLGMEERRNGSEGSTRTAERGSGATNGNADTERRKAAGEESLFFSDDEGSTRPQISKDKAADHPDEDFDDLDALLAESFERTAPTAKPAAAAASRDDPPEDDLDALLAEDAATAMSASAHPAKPAPAPTRDDFDDEMDAMAGVEIEMEGGGMW